MDLVERLVTAVQEGEDERAAALAEEVLKEFQECYDIRKAPLTQEYLDLYQRLKEETAGLGIEFPY